MAARGPRGGGVLVLAAVERELAPLRRALATPPMGRSVTLQVTGVGKAAAAYETARALSAHRPRLCLQVGCAGAFRGAGLEMGDVVVATREIFGDDGAEGPEGFLDLKQLGLSLAGAGGSPVYNEVPVTAVGEGAWEAMRAGASGRFTLHRGPLVTVSTASGTAARAREIARRWSPVAETLEGAAVALACLRFGCAFVEVRGISNFTGERGRWDIETAVEHAAEVLVPALEREALP